MFYFDNFIIDLEHFMDYNLSECSDCNSMQANSEGQAMQTNERLDRIVSLVEERGFISVGDLSKLCQVSEMTIRRDLARLDQEKRIQRTFGGAAPFRTALAAALPPEEQLASRREGLLLNRVDVLVATSVNPKYDGLLLERVGNKKIPIIAESLSIQNEESVVAVDNFQAAQELGRQAGEYAREHWNGRARILDLTFHLANTQARSRGFTAGVLSVLPDAEVVLSLDAQSRYDTAYQLTKDALTVHLNINIIFAINDIIAWGAYNACRDLGIDPNELIVIPFGLEGDTLKNALMDCQYCKIGLAMFPEIVGPVCIEAAIAAFNHEQLPHQLLTPYMILTADTLPKIYQRHNSSWHLRWDVANQLLSIPREINPVKPRADRPLPQRIGFVVPFSEHEWYKNLIASMQDYADRLKVEFEVVDAEENQKDEIDFRRRQIARVAAQQVQPGEVILIDGGPIANYLAEVLVEKQSMTIITNSIPVFEILKHNPKNILVLTGGTYRSSSQVLVGPTAEGALRELRADKLFLMVSGITLNFGLSHTNISEVTIKQAMIRSAREVILLADHSFFGQESVIQVANLNVVNKVITDDALPASVRLELMKLGIQIILAYLSY
jgi:DeoR family fructose operon transcriptional repressor